MTTKARIKREVEELLHAPGADVRPLRVSDIARSRGIEVVLGSLESDENISGFYFREGERRVIGVNSAHARVRQRFTIAHELGHAILHDAEGLHLDQAFKFRDSRSSLAIDRDEIDANAFAAELLMPEDEVRRAVATEDLDVNDEESISRLARHFGVSPQALTYRLVNLGVHIYGQSGI